jgi:hypothetical protein
VRNNVSAFKEILVMKKTLYVLAVTFAISAAIFGLVVSSPSNVMAKGISDGISSNL